MLGGAHKLAARGAGTKMWGAQTWGARTWGRSNRIPATRAKPTWKRDFRVPHKQADDQLLE